MDELNEWEQQIRANNVISHENVMVTMKEAAIFAEEHKGEYDQAFVVFYKRTEDDKIKSSWLNAGMHFSEVIFLFQYLTADFLRQMQNPDE